MKIKVTTSKHVLADRIPLILAAGIMVAMSYVPNTLASLVLMPFASSTSPLVTLVYCALSAAIAFLALVLFDKWFSPEYEGSITMKGFVDGIKYLLPVIAFWAVWMTLKGVLGYVKWYPLDAESLLKGIRPGVLEESAYRGMAMALILRKYHKPSSIWLPIVFTSIIFGLMHLTNIFGEDLSSEMVFQMAMSILFATAFGVIFAIVYSLSGSIWPTTIVHAAYDTAANCMESFDATPDWINYVDITATLVLMVLLIVVFLRNRDKAVALWAKKWGKTASE